MAVNGSQSHSSNNKIDESPRVLSIQSHVVHGYVGNKSATFPLQVLGFDVDAINTVQFSNHTHYKHVRGPVLSHSDLSDLIEGLSLNGIDTFTHLLTGYSRDPLSLEQVAIIVKKLREKNPNLIYVCDPVMGDNGRMYVPETILPVYRDTVIPLADIITPNQYEAELLTGIRINSVADAWNAIDCLHAKGIKVVVFSSTELGDDSGMLGLASTAQGERFTIKIPKLPVFFIGTGDLFASLMLAWTYKTNNDVKFSLEKTIATMQHVLKDTYRYAKEKCCGEELTPENVELRLIQNKFAIENPQVEIRAIASNKSDQFIRGSTTNPDEP